MKPIPITTRMLLPLAGVLVVLLGGFVVTAYLRERSEIFGELEGRLTQIERFLDTHIEGDSEEMSSALATIGERRELREALAARDRDRLLELAGPLFHRLQNSAEITHFYFTGPDRVNLLRVHKPDRHGDVIDRWTTLEAERTGEPASGIELGPLGTFTLRVVHPWKENGEVIGFVELGHEIAHLLEVLRRTLDIELCGFIKKEYLSREDWESGLRMLGREGKWNQFSDAVAVDEMPTRIPQAFVRRLSREGIDGLRRNRVTRVDGRFHYIASIPWVDAGGRNVGRLVAAVDFTDRRAAMVRFVLAIAVISLAVGGFLLGIFVLYAGRLERKLDQPS